MTSANIQFYAGNNRMIPSNNISNLPQDNLIEANISLSDITKLRKFGNQLLARKTLSQICDDTFNLIEKEIHPQVSSIFIFQKDGYIERVGIRGIDIDRNRIPADWLNKRNDEDRERYRPGDGFSGFVVKPKEDDIYGEPLLSTNIEQDFTLIFGQQYKEKLGFLGSGISVPLNGTHRTFGTIEVLNKINPNTGSPDPDCYLNKRDFVLADNFRSACICCNFKTS